MTTSQWTPESFALLESLKAQNLKTPVVQEALANAGFFFSERAIRNKVWRVSTGSNPYRMPSMYKTNPETNKPWKDDEPTDRAVSMEDLTAVTCRWPVKGNLYCGCAVVRGVYCAPHAARGYAGKA